MTDNIKSEHAMNNKDTDPFLEIHTVSEIPFCTYKYNPGKVKYLLLDNAIRATYHVK